MRDLHFELEIGDGAKSADKDVSVFGFCEIDGKSVKEVDFDVFDTGVGAGAADEAHAVFDGQKGVFRAVFEHGDDDLAENGGGTFDDIEMSFGYRVETARVYSRFHFVTLPVFQIILRIYSGNTIFYNCLHFL